MKTPREVAGFLALPVSLRSPLTTSEYVLHYIYLKPHDPKIADENAARSLFLVNIPVTTTEQHLKHLFTKQLGAGRVEQVHFSENGTGRASIATGSRSKKRKRQTAEEIEAGLDAYDLPKVYSSELRPSGSTAIVMFLDRPSMELSLTAARKASKSNQKIVWGDGMKKHTPLLGLSRYEEYNRLRYPSRSALLRVVDGYMSAYAQMEEARSEENAKKQQVPDEDGFVIVTRGAKGGFRKEEADELSAKQKAKSTGFEDFYRFQMREKRKEQQDEMLRQFEDDKRKVQEMRKRSGRLAPE